MSGKFSLAGTLGKHGRVAWITGGIVLLGGLVLAAVLAFTRSPAPQVNPPSGTAVPAPETEHMEGPVRRSLEQARKRVETTPGSGLAWGTYGAICDAHGLYECAEVCYTRASELDAQDFRWFYLLGFVSELQGAPADRVVVYYEQAVRLEPRLPTTLYRLGEALTRAGRLEEARAAYKRAVAIDPKFTAAHRGLGQVALVQDDLPVAIEHLERAVALGADRNRATLASLAQAQLRIGDTTAAEANAARSSEATAELPIPDPVRFRVRELNLSAAASSLRALRLIQAGSFDAALEQLRIVEETDPDQASTHYRIGLCLGHLGQLDEALVHLERAAELAPDNERVKQEVDRVRALKE